MTLTKQQIGYIIAGVLGIVLIAIVVVVLLNVRAGNKSIDTDAVDVDESRANIERSFVECNMAQDEDICRRQVVMDEAVSTGVVSLCDALTDDDLVTCVNRVAAEHLNKEMCRSLSGDDRNVCEDDVTARLAKQGKDIRLCDGVQDESARDTCKEVVESYIVAEGSCREHGVDPSLCESTQIVREAVDSMDLSKCDIFVSGDEYDGCRMAVLEVIEEVEDDNPSIDTDGDGLTDEAEAEYGTDINNPDTDGDGYLDGEEVQNGFNPNGPGTL